MNPVVQMLLQRVGGAILDSWLKGPDRHQEREERLQRDLEALEEMERQLPATQPAAPSSPPVEAAVTEETAARSVLQTKARALAVKVKAGELTHDQAVEELRRTAQVAPPTAAPAAVETASTEETIADLKHRLGKELYRLELDLLTGGRIAGRPCDCFSKHALGLEAMAEELMTMDRDPVYAEITTWLRQREPEFTLAAVAQTEPSYYQGLAPTVRGFFKRLMGTESPGAMLT